MSTAPGVGVKNLMDWVAGSLAFFLIGFGFMFGASENGLIGGQFFLGNGIDSTYTLIFFLFQLAFAGTSLTIVSGAMSGRTGLLPYFIMSFFTAVVIYPIFGFWAWGNLLNADNQPWLASLGFMDFAGVDSSPLCGCLGEPRRYLDGWPQDRPVFSHR